MRLSAALNWFKTDEDPYKILGVSHRSSGDEVKQAYRKLVMVHHPDKGGDIITVSRINNAYSIIRKKRGIY